MIQDGTRIQLFKEAIESVVKTGDVVVDIGTGLGTYAFFAARAGARKVYAIEKTNIIYLAEEIGQKNNFHRQIEFIKGNSTDIVLDQKADVVIFEDWGPFVTRGELDEVIADANQKLKRDGVMIPMEMRLYIAPVESSKLYNSIDTFRDVDDVLYEIDFSMTRALVMNEVHAATLTVDSLLAPPQEWHRYVLKGESKSTPLGGISLRSTCDRELTFAAGRAGILHGIAGWFDAILAEGIVLSNAPETRITSWGQVFFPLTQPLPIESNAEIHIRVFNVKSGNKGKFWWTWTVAASETVIEGSTFRSIPLPMKDFG